MGKKEGTIPKEASDEVLLREGNISLVLDSYDDIFSDFDPRPYDQKALSDDFLLECKRAAEGKKAEVELRLLIPKHRRNTDAELKIRKRLRNHFQKHSKEKEEEKRRIRRKGIILFIIGSILILATTLVYQKEGFLYTLLIVILEPAGWFTIWTAFERIFIDSNEKVPDLGFYKVMSKTKVNFYSY
ncbi:MAG: hypothetical protein V1645_02160 [archaeon]